MEYIASSEEPDGLFKVNIRHPDPNQVISITVDAMRALNRRIEVLEGLEHKRLTKIKRLRQGIRSLQACHERDSRIIHNIRVELNGANVRIRELRRIVGLGDRDGLDGD